MYGSFGMQLIILLNILLVIFIYFLNNRIIYIKEKIQKSERRIFKQFFADGIKYIFSDEVLLSYFVLFMLMNFLVGPTEEIFAPTIIKTLHGFSNINYGWTGTFISLGIVIASVILTFNLNKKISLINCFYVQAIIMIITGILSIFLMKNNIFFFVIYLFLCFLSGYFSTFVNVPLISKFQMLVEQKYQTRFFSNLSFFSNLMIPLGIAFAGIMCEVLRSDVAYMFNGILMVVCIKVLSKKSIG